jgi:hypothetical protein
VADLLYFEDDDREREIEARLGEELGRRMAEALASDRQYRPGTLNRWFLERSPVWSGFLEGLLAGDACHGEAFDAAVDLKLLRLRLRQRLEEGNL